MNTKLFLIASPRAFHTASERTDRGSRLNAWSIVILVMLCLVAFPAIHVEGVADGLPGKAGDIPVEPSLQEAFPSITLVRCLFGEGRLVVKHKDEMRVLHSGDRIPEAGLLVVEIGEDRVILHSTETKTLPSGVTVPKVIATISQGSPAGVSVRLFNSEAPEDGTTFILPQAADNSVFTTTIGINPTPSPVGSLVEAHQTGDQNR